MAEAFVYFMAAGDPPEAVKIGVTRPHRMRSRLRSLQTGNHRLLRILGLIHFEGHRAKRRAEELEGELHARFAAQQRFKPGYVGSEWFSAANELLALIRDQAESPAVYGIKDRGSTKGPGGKPNS
jgi:hypothetical protein